jgi:hypothetical protein
LQPEAGQIQNIVVKFFERGEHYKYLGTNQNPLRYNEQFQDLECLLSFTAEYFILSFQSKNIDEDLQNCTFVCSVWAWNLFSPTEGGM